MQSKVSNMKIVNRLLARNNLVLLLSVAMNLSFIVFIAELLNHGERLLDRCVHKDMKHTVENKPRLEVRSSVSPCTCEQSNTDGNGSNTPISPTVQVVQEHHILVVAVMSSPHNVARRNAIRETWKMGYKERVHYVKFVIGTKSLSTDLIEGLKKENLSHQDMVLLASIDDSYRNLSHKVLATLVWFDQNVNYLYLLKTDDDSFVILDILEDELHKRDHIRGLYWGYFAGNNSPNTDGKWAEPNWKFCDKYFPYAYGGGYILSASVVHRIVSNAEAMIVYNNEDVSVGAWTVVYDIERKHDMRFDTESVSRGCSNTFVITHKQSIKDMLCKHKLYLESGKLCEQEKLLQAYEYDWSALPSKAYKKKCCWAVAWKWIKQNQLNSFKHRSNLNV